MDKENTFSKKLGRLVADVIVACIAACLSACAIALTVKFILWLF